MSDKIQLLFDDPRGVNDTIQKVLDNRQEIKELAVVYTTHADEIVWGHTNINRLRLAGMVEYLKYKIFALL